MDYKLFLDDNRYPDNHPDWRIARSYHDAVWCVKTYGVPYHISFDHDLSYSHYIFDWDGTDNARPPEFTGLDFAKWFCYHVLDNELKLPDGFTYNVHSMNPVGAANIRSFMASFMKDGYV